MSDYDNVTGVASYKGRRRPRQSSPAPAFFARVKDEFISEARRRYQTYAFSLTVVPGNPGSVPQEYLDLFDADNECPHGALVTDRKLPTECFCYENPEARSIRARLLQQRGY